MASNQDDPGPSADPQDPQVTPPATAVGTPEQGQDWFGPQGDLRSLQAGLAAFDEQVREGRQTPDRRRRLEQPPGLPGQPGQPGMTGQGGHLMDAEELRQSLQSITGILQGLTARVQGLEGAQQSSTTQLQQGLGIVDQRLQAVEQGRSAGPLPGGVQPGPAPAGHTFAFGGLPPPPAPMPSPVGQDPLGAGKNMDTKWIPTMPVAQWQQWKTRTAEIAGFWSWIDSLASWLSLLQSSFGAEIKEALAKTSPLYDSQLSSEQTARAQRLAHLLRQAFSGFHRVETIARAFETETCTGATNGYELLRLLRTEFSVQTRTEAISLRQEFLRTHISRYDHLPDLLRQIDVKLFQFHQLIGTYPRPLEVRDLYVGESDLYLMILRALPKDIQEYVKLHAGQTVAELKASLLYHHERTRVVSDLGKVHAVLDDKGKGKGKHGDKGKGKGKYGDKGKGKGKSRPFSADSNRSKGKGKGGKGNKGQKGSGKSSPRGSSSEKEQRRREGLCYECGAKGHLARDCPKKNKVKSIKKNSLKATSDDAEYDQSEPEEERMMMTLTSVVFSEERSRSLSCKRTPESREEVNELPSQQENARSLDDSAMAWLVDSGATSHIVSRRFLKHYKVVTRYPHLKCQLSAANGQEIPNEGIADIEVKFSCWVDGKQSLKSFALSRAIIAEIPFCVLSPFVLLKHGWSVHLGDAMSSYLKGGRQGEGVKVPLTIDKRAWWVVAKGSKSGAQAKRRSKSQPSAMEVDHVQHDTHVPSETEPKTNVLNHPETSASSQESGSQLQSILKRSSVCTQQVGGLSFLVRGLQHDVLVDSRKPKHDMSGRERTQVQSGNSGTMKRETTTQKVSRDVRKLHEGLQHDMLKQETFKRETGSFDSLSRHVLVFESSQGSDDDDSTVFHGGRSGYTPSCSSSRAAPPFERDDASVTDDDEFFECQSWGTPVSDMGSHGFHLETQAGEGIGNWSDVGTSSDTDTSCSSLESSGLQKQAGQGLGDLTMDGHTLDFSCSSRALGNMSVKAGRGLGNTTRVRNMSEVGCMDWDSENVHEGSSESSWKVHASHVSSKGLDEVPGRPHGSFETCWSETDDMEDRPLPGLDEPVESSEERDVEEAEPEASGVELYSHVAHGHQPYLSTCMSCVRACGRAPARRLRHAHGPSSIGADFTFMGSLKILVIVVFCTGFLSAFVMDPVNSESNARSVNRALKEGGLTGRHVELNSDGEATLLALFRTATSLENSPVTGLSYSTFAPERSQANGRVERANQSVKELTAANLFFLEAQIGRRVPLESPLVGYAIDYACKTHNAYHLKQGSRATVLDRIRGRLNTPRPSTLPFGCLAFGKPVSSSAIREQERLMPFIYLGPILSTGGGCIGIAAKEARIGLSEEEVLKVRRFQTARAVVPCQWPSDDLEILCLPVPPNVPPPAEFPVELNPEGDPSEVPEAADAPPRRETSPIVVPASGPPKQWILDNGATPDCYACEQIKKKGKAHGRVHSAACKNRYKERLQQQAREREEEEQRNKRARREEPVAPAPMPGVLPAPPAAPPPVAAPGADVDMENLEPSPAGDEMDIDALVDHHVREVEDDFLGRSDPTSIGNQLFVSHSWKLRATTDAAVHWFQCECLGRIVWQAIPIPMRCETSGQTMNQKDIVAAFEKEFSQLTHLKVGKWITESEAK